MLSKFKLLKPALMMTLVLTLSACASKESVKLVGEYAKQSAKVQQTLHSMYDSADEARVNAVLAGAVRDGIPTSQLDVELIDSQGQRTALDSLLQYSKALHSLAAYDFGADIDEETAELNSSLVSIADNPLVEDVTQDQVQVASTAINALARASTESSRYKALKQVMSTSQPVVNSTISVLREELPAWQAALQYSLNKELNLRTYLLNNPNRCEVVNDKRCVTFHHTLEERMGAYRQAYQLKQTLVQLDDQFAKLDEALVGLLELNSAIVTSLNVDDDVSLKAAKRALRSSKRQVDAIKQFNKSLKEE